MTSAQSQPTGVTSVVPAPPAAHDGVHDFDFLHGTWRIHNRRLRNPLTGSADWYEFEGRSIERPLWDGRANIEEYDATLPDGTRVRGLALRLYDPGAKRWTIHWSNASNGMLDPTMYGTFRDGVGTFYSHEDYEGRMILVRFLWTRSGHDSARWAQAFSTDGGRTWETNWVMDFIRTGSVASLTPRATDRCCRIVELRRYVLHPGRRDELIALFDREFIETQEATGMTVIGQFRDLDHPDVFTWLRGFPDMESRARSLSAFYDGPVWRAYRTAANATMISSDDVRLLRPARDNDGFDLGDRAAPDTGLVVASVYTLRPDDAPGFGAFFAEHVEPALRACGIAPLAVLETERAANTFPRLPVREGEGERAFVWFARYADANAHHAAAGLLREQCQWYEGVLPRLEERLAAPAEEWRLAPTARSRRLADGVP